MPRKRKSPTQSDILPTDRLLMLMGFIGQDILMHTRNLARASMEKETIEITGKILGGKFKLTVSFDGEVAH